MMIPHPLSTIQLQRMLRACIYAVLLCAFLGVVADTRAQSKTDVCNALDLSTAECALITGVSTTLPAGVTLPQVGCCPSVATAVPWFVSTVRTAGANSLRSGAIDHSEASCLVLDVSLPDTRQLRFSLRTSSQGQQDRLAFFAGNQTVIENFSAAEGSDTKDWEQQSFAVTSDVSNLSWCYLKNASTSAADDSGWLDNLSFIPPSPVCPILDMSDEECALITATSYEPPGSPWSANSTATLGSDSLRSRGVRSSQQSCLILNVSLPDRTLVQFSRRVNSQPADELYFSIDDVRQEYSLRPAATAALRDWSREVHILFESGDKVLSWCYVKDASGTEGADRAWIDDLSLIAPPAAPLNRDVVCLVLDMSLEDCELITSYASVPPDPSWYISYFNSEGGFSNGETSLRSDPAVDDNRFSCLVLGVTLPADTRIGFSLRTDSEGGRDFLYFEADGVRLIENYSAPLNSNIRDFEPLEFEVTNPVSELRWCYQKDAILSVGDDSVWLDRLYFIPQEEIRPVCAALDMSDQDCARITSVSTMPPDDLVLPPIGEIGSEIEITPVDIPWFVSGVRTRGANSLQSGLVGINQASCLVLAVALPAGTALRFSLRSDTNAAFHRLVFAADNQLLIESFRSTNRQPVRNWEIQEFNSASSISKLSWCYLKDVNPEITDQQRGWLDALSFFITLSTGQICQDLDLSAEDCALITDVSTTLPTGLTLPTERGQTSIPGNVPWFASNVATEGDFSLRSGTIGHSEASCLVLAVALPANTTIHFSLRTDSEGRGDRLVFAADTDILIENFSAPLNQQRRDWEARQVTLANSASNLSWCYLKGRLTSLEQDSGWLDALSFTLPSGFVPTQPVCAALDMSADDCARITSVSTMPPEGLVLPPIGEIGSEVEITPVDIPWFVSGVRTRGANSLQSGLVGINQASCLVLGVSLPTGTALRFSLRSDTHAIYHRLVFAADNQLLIESFRATDRRPVRDWEIQEFNSASSISKLSWCYLKDVNPEITDQQRGWLDALSFFITLSTGQICQDLDLSAEDCALITGVSTTLPTGLTLPTELGQTSIPGNVPWFASNVATEGDFSLRSGTIGHSEASCLVLAVALPANTVIRFSLRTDSEGRDDRLAFAADNQILIQNFSAPVNQTRRNWEARQVTLANSASNLSWCYLKARLRSLEQDSGWLDALSFIPPPTPDTLLTRELVCTVLDMSTEDCALITHIGSDPAAPPWYVSNTNSEGGNSLRSDPDVDHLETSCLVLGVALPGDRMIQFFLRTDSEGDNDFLYFEADGARLIDTFAAAEGSSLRDFEEVNVFLAGDISKLAWCYTKNISGNAGDDSGWLDRLSFSAAGARTSIALTPGLVCQALDLNADNCALIDSVAADPPGRPWVLSAIATEGSLSLRSGDIDNSQTSCLVLGITLPADRSLRFSLRTDSEAVNDFLYFEVDGTRLVDRFSAPQDSTRRDWEQLDILISGISSLKWCYTKNGSTSAGEDSGWLDALTFTVPGVTKDALCTALDMSDQDCALISSVSTILPPGLILAQQPVDVPWSVSMSPILALEGGSSLRSGDIDHSEASCLVLGVTLPINTLIRFSLRTSSQGLFDHLTFAADSQTVIENFSAAEGDDLRRYEQQEYNAPNRISNLSWCYQKSRDTKQFSDAGWLDTLSFSLPVPLSKTQLCTALDLSTGDCALISSISTILPPGLMLQQPVVDALWSVSMTVDNQGGSSLRSGNIGHSEASCLVLAAALPAGILIRFSLRTSSQGLLDHLTFAADSQTVIANFSAPEGDDLRNWEQQEYSTTNPVNNLSWCYQKNGNTDGASDAGWLDTLSFTAPASLSTTQLCTALDLSADNCSQIQSVSFDPPSFPWQIATDTSVAGSSSLRSADIDDGEQSCLVLNLPLSANSVITLASRTSSQGGFDQLQVIANNLRLDTLSAAIGTTEKPWGYTTYYLQTAATELRWCYVKNSATSSGEDSAWIDSLSFSTSDISYLSRICTALDLAEATCSMMPSIDYVPSELLWIITSQTSVLGGTSLRSPDIGDNGLPCLLLTFPTNTPLPANTLIRFSLRIDSEANDSLFFQAVKENGSEVERFTFNATNGSLRDWEQMNVLISDSITRMGWCHNKNGSTSAGEDAVWVDALSITIPLTTEDVCLALDMSTQECTLITGVASDPPQSLWQISPIATESSSSLRSADIEDGESSCLVLNLSPLVEQTLVQFSLRISSQPLADRLLFSADGQFLDYRLRPEADTVLRDWSRELYILPAGITSLSWCYRKDDMTSMGEDSVWIDDLSITSTTVVVLDRELVCLVLDIDIEDCGIIRSVAADPPASPWLISPIATESSSSLRSGDIDDSESSCLVLGITLSVDRGIRFSLRTDSEAVNDHLSFEAGGQELIETFAAAEGSTLRDWEPQQFLLAAGNSMLRWCYNKNGSTSSGADSGWLDGLSFVSAGLVQFEPLCEALDLFQAQCAIIRAVTYEPSQTPWLTTATESARGGSALVSPVPNTGESSCLTVEFHSPLTPNSPVVFDWRTTSQSEQDILQFQVETQQSQIANMPEMANRNGRFQRHRICPALVLQPNLRCRRSNRSWLARQPLGTDTDRSVYSADRCHPHFAAGD